MSIRKREKKWIADVTVGGRNGTRIRRVFPTRALALAFEREVKVQEIRGELNIDKPTPIELHNFIAKYLDLHESGNRTSTKLRDDYVLRHFLNYFGDIHLTEITREQLERYKVHRQKNVKSATVNLELRVIKSLFNRAQEWGYLKRLPTTGIKMIRIDQKEPRFLRPDECCTLIEAAEGQTATFITIAINTGLRKSELLNSYALLCLKHHPRHFTSPSILYNCSPCACSR